MTKIKFFSLITVFLFGIGTAFSQIKIGEMPGAPGAFRVSSTNPPITAALVFNSSGSPAFITNPGSGLVQKFNPATGHVLGSLQLPPGIGPAALSNPPNEQTLVVLGVVNQHIYIIDTDSMTVRWDVNYQPSGFNGRSGIVVTPNNLYFMFADATYNSIAVFSLYDGRLQRQFGVGSNPNYIIPYLNDRRRPDSYAVICSGLEGDKGVWLFDATGVVGFNSAPTESFSPRSSNNLAEAPNSTVLLLPSFGDNSIVRYDPVTGSGQIVNSRGIGPGKVVTSADGRFAAVVNATSKDVAIFTLPISPASFDHDIAISGLDVNEDTTPVFGPDGFTIYIPSASKSEVIAWDIANKVIKKRIATAKGSTFLNMNADGSIITSLDLTANVLSLIAKNPTPLYVPHLVQNSKEYAGVAVANYSSQSALVALTARDNKGVTIPGTLNPRYLLVPAGGQISLVAGQIFGFNPTDTLEGYIEAYTLTQGVTLLYLTGTIDQTQLDGFVADSTTGKLLGFSRVTDGVMKFGSPSATEIILENPSETDADTSLTLYANTPSGPGFLIASQQVWLPAHNRMRSRVSELFPVLSKSPYYPLDNGYLELNSSVPIKALERVKIGNGLSTIAASLRALKDTTFLAPQLASGGSDTPVYFTNLAMANTSLEEITVTAKVVFAGKDPVPPGYRQLVRTLQPHEALTGSADELFGFPDPLADPTLYQGTLKITTDKPGLIADLVYGDARAGSFLAMGGLRAQTAKNFGLGHLATGCFGEPPKEYYTGIAIYNTSLYAVNVTVEADGPDGKYLGNALLYIQPGDRVAQTIGQLIPSLVQQNGGTIKITGDLPVNVFGLYGFSHYCGANRSIAAPNILVSVVPAILTP